MFRRLMRLLTLSVGRQTRRTVRQYGVPVTDEQRDELAQALLPHVRRARAQAHDLGARSLTAQAVDLDIPAPPVQPVRPYKQQALVTALENVTRIDPPSRGGATVEVDGDIPDDAPRVSVTVLDDTTRRESRKTVEVTDDNRYDPEVVKKVADKLVGVVERHTRMPSREAITDAVEAADGEAGGEFIGYARVLTGEENCPFCVMLASRGAVYPSEKAARYVSPRSKRYDAREPHKFHDWCDCEIVLAVEGRDWKGRKEWEALEELWADATEKLPFGSDAAKAFAVVVKQKVADGEMGRYIPSAE